MDSQKKVINEIMSSVKYNNYTKSYNSFKTAFTKFISQLMIKLNALTTKTITFSFESGVLKLIDNRIFVYTGSNGVSNLTLEYPTEDFISTLVISTSKSGSVNINFPADSIFVGRKSLEFFPQEVWEINIHNRRVVAVQIFDNK